MTCERMAWAVGLTMCDCPCGSGVLRASGPPRRLKKPGAIALYVAASDGVGAAGPRARASRPAVTIAGPKGAGVQKDVMSTDCEGDRGGSGRRAGRGGVFVGLPSARE